MTAICNYTTTVHDLVQPGTARPKLGEGVGETHTFRGASPSQTRMVRQRVWMHGMEQI